ncbi:MAG: hypothetical protein ACTS2F_03150 [Thainema sp.]
MSSARSSASQSTVAPSNQLDTSRVEPTEYQTYIHQTASQSELQIAGIEHPTVICYFDWLNQEAYDQAVTLFTEDGILYAPFESGIQGRSAIADYLKTEAKGMQLQPREGVVQPIDDESEDEPENVPDEIYQILVTGKVQTSVFGVNVQWTFTLNQDDQLTAVRVKLLASPKELLNLRNK